MRGTRRAKPTSARTIGIIPALAGNTTPDASRWPSKRDHPRACGEHFHFGSFLGGVWGSSPRLRGTRRRTAAGRVRSGIIPALAGNTDAVFRGESLIGDHPRACGEHSRESRNLAARVGSSPRLRGTLADVLRAYPDRGIIPALAGNTPHALLTLSESGDHPRACGEHVIQVASQHGHQGSSPRLRGTR